jgi:predicted RNase H-like nuclease (RuvC/YqgF family)
MVMEQYEKSGPKQDRPVTNNTAQDIVQLEQLVKDQGEQIAYLKKEIVRIKRKMDAHATIINKINNG